MKVSRIVLAVAGASLGLLYVFLPFRVSRYCGEQHHFLSDEEFIEAAVRNEVPRGRIAIDGSEASIRTFSAGNPKCCRVTRRKVSFFERALGVDTVDVDMYYRVNEATLKHQLGAEYYGLHLAIDSCGRVLNSAGMEMRKQYVPTGFE
jgi:hypothetical protein